MVLNGETEIIVEIPSKPTAFVQYLNNGFKIKVQIFPAKHGSFCTFILKPILIPLYGFGAFKKKRAYFSKKYDTCAMTILGNSFSNLGASTQIFIDLT
jgi:hypothetical protein